MTPIRLAIIGFDHWHSVVPLARGLSRHPQTDPLLIADGDPGRGRALTSDLGTEFSTSLDDALQDLGIDVIEAFFSVEQNPGICARAAGAGEHIVSIKPLVCTLKEASAIVRAVERADIQLALAELRSWTTDQNQRLLEIARSDKLGRVVSTNLVLRGVPLKAWEGSESHGWWAEEGKALGDGQIDHAICQTGRLRWLLGVGPIDIIGHVTNLRYPQLPVEDYGHAIFTLSDDVVAAMKNAQAGVDGARQITTTLSETEGSPTIGTIGVHIPVLRPNAGTPLLWEQLEPLDNDSDLTQPLVDRTRGESNSLSTTHNVWRSPATARVLHDVATSGARRPVPMLASRDT